MERIQIFVFSKEGDPLEPCHIHVRRSGNLEKFRIVINILLGAATGCEVNSPNRLRRIWLSAERYFDIVSTLGTITSC